MIQWRNNNKWKAIFIILSIFLLSLSLGAYERKQTGSSKGKIRVGDMPIPETNVRILVFSPHPDDETIAAGGYLHMAGQAGAVMHIILVTDGNKHGLEKKRYQEFRKATTILGIEKNQLEFWKYPDGELIKADNLLYKRVRKTISAFQPDIILYPHPLDRHADHAELGRVVEHELYNLAQTGYHYNSYRYLVHYWLYPRPRLDKNNKLVPPTGFLGVDQEWRQIDLNAQDKAVKKQALQEYKTQLRNPFLRPLLVEFIRDNELFSQYTAE